MNQIGRYHYNVFWRIYARRRHRFIWQYIIHDSNDGGRTFISWIYDLFHFQCLLYSGSGKKKKWQKIRGTLEKNWRSLSIRCRLSALMYRFDYITEFYCSRVLLENFSFDYGRWMQRNFRVTRLITREKKKNFSFHYKNVWEPKKFPLGNDKFFSIQGFRSTHTHTRSQWKINVVKNFLHKFRNLFRARETIEGKS